MEKWCLFLLCDFFYSVFSMSKVLPKFCKYTIPDKFVLKMRYFKHFKRRANFASITLPMCNNNMSL